MGWWWDGKVYTLFFGGKSLYRFAKCHISCTEVGRGEWHSRAVRVGTLWHLAKCLQDKQAINTGASQTDFDLWWFSRKGGGESR